MFINSIHAKGGYGGGGGYGGHGHGGYGGGHHGGGGGGHYGSYGGNEQGKMSILKKSDSTKVYFPSLTSKCSFSNIAT